MKAAGGFLLAAPTLALCVLGVREHGWAPMLDILATSLSVVVIMMAGAILIVKAERR